MNIFPIDPAATESTTNTQGDAIRIESIDRDTQHGFARYKAWITWGAISFRAQIGVHADMRCFIHTPHQSLFHGETSAAPITAADEPTPETSSWVTTTLRPFVRIADDESLATLRTAAESWYWAQEYALASQRAEYAAQRRAVL